MKRKTKYCPDCKKIKTVSEFNKRTGYQKGMLASVCKPCVVIRSNAWKAKNKERYNLYQLNYRKAKLAEKQNGN